MCIRDRDLTTCWEVQETSVMDWKFWRRPKEPQSPVLLDSDSVAYDGIRSVVLGHNQRLDHWRKFGPELPEDVLSFLQRCVWTYQMQVLCDEVSRRYSPVYGDSVKGNLLKYFHVVPGPVSCEELFDAITKGRAIYQPGKIPQFADAPNAERDLTIANTFFYISDIPEDRKTGIWVAFAKCL